jgi:hypothetical protein
LENTNREYHSMTLETTYPSGAEEWSCPVCGRRLIMNWPPAYKKIILEYGNEHALHSCNQGGSGLLSTQIGFGLQKSSDSEEGLDPWQNWMENNNFDSLWKK